MIRLTTLIVLCAISTVSLSADWKGRVSHIQPGAIGCLYLSQLMDVHAMIEANDVAGLKAVVDRGNCIAITEETSATVTRSLSSYILSSHRVESNGIALWFRTRDMKCWWKYSQKGN